MRGANRSYLRTFGDRRDLATIRDALVSDGRIAPTDRHFTFARLETIKYQESVDRSIGLKDWHGSVYERSVTANGDLLPADESGVSTVRLVPLGVYSLNYPKMPLLLIDFRDKLHVRRHELAQRSINEITSGVIGISHFTNWYYYVGADLYDFCRLASWRRYESIRAP